MKLFATMVGCFRQLRETVADIEDARIIKRAKKAHGKQPRIPWAQAKKELGLP